MGPQSEPFTIGLIQDHATADAVENIALAERHVRDAAKLGAQIICLKELFHAEYFCKSQQFDRFDLAQDVPGPAVDAMQRLAHELAVVIIAPVFERQAPGLYRNSAAVIDADGSLLGLYRKMPVFTLAGKIMTVDGQIVASERFEELNGSAV